MVALKNSLRQDKEQSAQEPVLLGCTRLCRGLRQGLLTAVILAGCYR